MRFECQILKSTYSNNENWNIVRTLELFKMTNMKYKMEFDDTWNAEVICTWTNTQKRQKKFSCISSLQVLRIYLFNDTHSQMQATLQYENPKFPCGCQNLWKITEIQYTSKHSIQKIIYPIEI